MLKTRKNKMETITLPKADFEYILNLLKATTVRLDACFCEGKLVGPDRELVEKIDKILKEHISIGDLYMKTQKQYGEKMK